MFDAEPEDWIKKLKDDLVRINKVIDRQRAKVHKGIDNLRVLEKTREDILNDILK
jgi:hypothetical protein